MDQPRPLALGLGKAVRKLRLAAEWSQEDLAGEAEVHRTFVSELERGLRLPGLDTICAIADALGLEGWALVQAAEQEASKLPKRRRAEPPRRPGRPRSR